MRPIVLVETSEVFLVMIYTSNPHFIGQVVGCGVPSLDGPIVEFAKYQRNYPGKVTTKFETNVIVVHEQGSTAAMRPVAFKNLLYPQLIEIDGQRLKGGLRHVPWPESDEVVQRLTVQYFEYADSRYYFMTTLQLFFPLVGEIPQRCQWIWDVRIEDYCEDVYRHCALPEGAYCATYQCADENGIHTVEDGKQSPLKNPRVIAMKDSFLAGLIELAKVQEGDNIRSQEFGAR